MNGKTALILIPGAGRSDWIRESAKSHFRLPAIPITGRLDQNSYQARKKFKMWAIAAR